MITTSQIFDLARQSNIQIVATFYPRYGNKDFCCSFEAERDGMKIEGRASSKESLDDAVAQAWAKLDSLAKRGNPRLLAPMIEGPSAEPIEPIGVTDDGIPF